MAARRLIFVLIVMLLLSSLAAALVPVERERREQASGSSTSTTTSPPPAVPTTGRLVEGRLDASAKRPGTVEIALGDQLQLAVEADRPDTIAIPALGEFHDVEPGSAATFDLLPFEARRYAVRLVDADRLAGWINVAPPPRNPGEKSGGGEARSGEQLSRGQGPSGEKLGGAQGRSGKGLDQDKQRPDGGEAGADEQAGGDA